MTKKKKILIIVFSIIAFAVAVAVTVFVTNRKLLSYAFAAPSYLKEKYGDRPIARSVEGVHETGFSVGPLCGAIVHYKDFDVLVTDSEIADNRQYDDIVSAFKEEYLNLDEIYSELSDCTVELNFHVTVPGHSYKDFTSRYFDGNIADFIHGTKANIVVTTDGEGFHEKYAETPELLHEKLEKIYNSSRGDVRVYAYVHDPTLDLPDMPLEYYPHDSYRFKPKRYDDYMELIAAGIVDKDGIADTLVVQQPLSNFYDIDEFTAISDCDYFTPVASEKDYIFSRADFSQDTKVYPGNATYRLRSEPAEEYALTIRPEGLYCGFDSYNMSRSGHDFILRLDREHYNITDSTIALRVAQSAYINDFKERQNFNTFGYSGEDGFPTDTKDWYYADDKYLYLFVPHICHDLFTGEYGQDGVYIAFTDVEN